MDFEQLAERMQPKIKMLLNQLRIYHNREEYAQLALIALWQAHQSYVPGKYDFFAYLYNQMRFDLIDMLRKEIKLAKSIIPVEDNTLILMAENSEKESILLPDLDDMFEELSNEEKILLHMMFFEERSNQQISQYFNISIAATRKRKYRLLQKLKQLKDRVI